MKITVLQRQVNSKKKKLKAMPANRIADTGSLLMKVEVEDEVLPQEKKMSVQLDSLCRMCAKPLSSVTSSSPTVPAFTLMFQLIHLLGIDVSLDDGLPKRVCCPCSGELSRWEDVRSSVLQTQTCLRQIRDNQALFVDNQHVIGNKEKCSETHRSDSDGGMDHEDGDDDNNPLSPWCTVFLPDHTVQLDNEKPSNSLVNMISKRTNTTVQHNSKKLDGPGWWRDQAGPSHGGVKHSKFADNVNTRHAVESVNLARAVESTSTTLDLVSITQPILADVPLVLEVTAGKMAQPALVEETVQGTERVPKKRTRNEKEWKSNIRKAKRQHNEDYVDRKGILHPKTDVKIGCKGTCLLNCMKIFSDEDRKMLHNSFWKLNDSEKNYYYTQNTQRLPINRRRIFYKTSKRNHTYKYFMNLKGVKTVVCQHFFINTLGISSRRIYYAHENIINPESNLPRSIKKGKSGNRKTKESDITCIKDHINSFPIVKSHECHTNPTIQYLEQNLSVAKMYKMFKDKNPLSKVKENVYRSIFKTCFNYSFYTPQKRKLNASMECKL